MSVCGGGLAVAAMAEAFPNSEFHGYDPSEHAIDRCREKIAARNLGNLNVFVAGGEALPRNATYDFMITFDCLHDMTRPAEVIAAIRRALKPDGAWLIKDIRSTPDFKQNRRKPPAGDVLWLFRVRLHVVSAFRTRRRRTGHPGIQSGRGGIDGAGRRASAAFGSTTSMIQVTCTMK